MKLRTGTIKRGRIVPDEPIALAEGSKVTFGIADEMEDPLLWLAKEAEKLGDLGLPSDFSAEHDHYLYGTPKRDQR